jgi:hypothetical protein
MSEQRAFYLRRRVLSDHSEPAVFTVGQGLNYQSALQHFRHQKNKRRIGYSAKGNELT